MHVSEAASGVFDTLVADTLVADTLAASETASGVCVCMHASKDLVQIA